MSESLEKYLKTIYLLINKNSYARVTDIANELKCTKPSVNRALKVLNDEGLIIYETYGDILLTKKGKNLAKKIINSQTIIKSFLTMVLNVNDDIAEQEASIMRHSVSEDTILKLENYIQGIIDISELKCNYNPESEKCRKCAKGVVTAKYKNLKI